MINAYQLYQKYVGKSRGLHLKLLCVSFFILGFRSFLFFLPFNILYFVGIAFFMFLIIFTTI